MTEVINKAMSFKLYIKDFIATVLIIILCVILLIIPDSASSGISHGLNICASVLIPSLFPFMVISSFAVRSGISVSIGKFFSPITRFLFNLPGCTGATIILSLIGGYPAGARGIQTLLEKRLINQEQANRMLCFTVAAGPAFIVTIIGNTLFKNKLLGFILFFAQIFSSVITGILVGIISKFKNLTPTKEKQKVFPSLREDSALVLSCIDATRSMINMCAFVILFSGIISVLNDIGFSNRICSILTHMGLPVPIAASLVSSVLEVTVGCIDAVSNGACPVFISFITGWAGLCVHLQILSIIRNSKINYLKFLFFRIINASISSIIVYLVLSYTDTSIYTFSSIKSQPSPSVSSTILGSIALVFTCIHFIFTLLPPEPSKNLEPVKTKSFNN